MKLYEDFKMDVVLGQQNSTLTLALLKMVISKLFCSKLRFFEEPSTTNMQLNFNTFLRKPTL